MGPLYGVRILELAGIGPGPFACMLLADLGAQVLRIERIDAPQRADEPDPLLRGRPAVRVDLKQAAGLDFVRARPRDADALVEGFRPGVTERLGLGPADCHAINPRLVYGRMTGWGQGGPLARTAGHDINYIALTGALHAIGEPGRKPVPPLNLVGDFGGGALYLALGVVSALFEARGSGVGQVVDAAITDGAASLMAMMYGKRGAGRWTDERGCNGLDGGAPWYDTYATADGGHVAVGAIEPRFFAVLCERLGLAPEWTTRRDDPDTWPTLRAELQAVFLRETREHWATLLQDTDACVAPVLSMAEAPQHAHQQSRGAFVTLDGVVQPAPAPRFSRTGCTVADADSTTAEHVLQQAWGCTPQELGRLAKLGVART